MSVLRRRVSAEEKELFSLYSHDIGKIERISHEKQKELFAKLSCGDESAKSEFLRSFLPMVIDIAFKAYNRNPTTKLCDLIGWGNIGLMEALRRFKPEKNCCFSTFAVFWVRRLIHDSIKALPFLTHPDYVSPNRFEYAKIREHLLETYKSAPSVDEIAKAMNIPFKYATGLDALSKLVKLQSELEFNDNEGILRSPYYEAAADGAVPVPDLVGQQEMMDIIDECIARLSPFEREVIKRRYGLGDYGGKQFSLQEIGDIYNLSRERIRQVEERARGILFKKLKKLSDFAGLDFRAKKVLARIRYAKPTI